MVFSSLLDFANEILSLLGDFGKMIIDFMSFKITLFYQGELITYPLYMILFGSGLVIVLIIKIGVEIIT